ncbi:plasmid replication protein RepC [Polycladidibacter hongkongensis]|uniref:plasmid replication protein RepC n=1 Tax=Polycladidibacter hongkongensis TaxID=1647556 RepID=UPI00082A1BF0|nr:plasmid replication protein RepC [Pseudovibrio hongkongensis]
MRTDAVASFRKLTPAMLESQRLAQANDIVETTKAEAAITIKKAAPALGIDGTTYHVLDILLGLSRADDWGKRHRPIVAISNDKLAEYVCRSTRTVMRSVRKLVEAGILAYKDSPTGRRFIYRDEGNGAINRAYGFDFSPARQNLEKLRAQGKAYQEKLNAQQEAKRTVSRLSRAIIDSIQAAAVADLDLSAYEDELYVLRESGLSLSEKAASIEELYQRLLTEFNNEDTNTTCKSDTDVTPYNYTNHKNPENSKQQNSANAEYLNINSSAANAASKMALDKKPNSKFGAISPELQQADKPKSQMAMPAASSGTAETALSSISISLIETALRETKQTFALQLQNWRDLTDGAESLRLAIGLSPAAWGAAQHCLGAKAASAILAVTVEKTLRDPMAISNPAGYFQACIERAKEGNLLLHKSLFGLAAG